MKYKIEVHTSKGMKKIEVDHATALREMNEQALRNELASLLTVEEQVQFIIFYLFGGDYPPKLS